MNYELAKQLKDAGYPEPDNIESAQGDMVLGDDLVYRPTLEELSEACKKSYHYDGYVYSFVIKYVEEEKPYWFAGYEYTDGWDEGPEGYGETPNEAVANLWLKLQEVD